MRYYQAPTKQFEQILSTLDYKNDVYDQDTVRSLLETAGGWVEKNLFPTNQIGDEVGLEYKNQRVNLPNEFKSIYSQMIDNGTYSIGMPAQWGGLDAPPILVNMMMEMLSSGNLSLSTCSLLTSGAVSTIQAFGDDYLKATYLPKMVSGKYSGTMCLTESQCGTDLGMIRTKAYKKDDKYIVTGDKIWISFGEHNLTENIIHLVLARLPDAPEGVKGISLFLVPKFLEDGKENKVTCQGLEHKMGSHASPTCFMNYDNSIGYLIGEPHQGLKLMFHMMNAARLAVGVQGIGVAEIAFQTAKQFANDRRQSRVINPNRREMDFPADRIIVHPDVRRMLMTVECQIIAMRALVAYVGIVQEKGDEHLLGHLTPIIKSFCTERSTELVSESLQVLGGIGYTKDGAIEQYLRDVRITMIYEGTNGIQALDLVGRKMMKDAGATIRRIITMLREFPSDDEQTKLVLDTHAEQIEAALTWLAKNGLSDPELAAASSSDFLRLMATALMSYMWAHLIKEKDLEKLARFHQTMIAPEAILYLSRVKAGHWVT
tara:strand:- start:1622 stop:3253 length:1632 start_codon:yes stop_codon:yes gene_type:complete